MFFELDQYKVCTKSPCDLLFQLKFYYLRIGTNMQIISILKFIKRLFWDVWLVFPNILVDLKAGKNVRQELQSCMGRAIVPSNLSSRELSG